MLRSASGRKLKGGQLYRQNLSFKEAVRKRDKHTCQICGALGRIVDHAVPYAIKPETRPGGVRVLCHSCNLATRQPRRDALLPLDEWYQYVQSELEATS